MGEGPGYKANDITFLCLSCGALYAPPGDPAPHPAGLLGSLEADKSGRGTFQVITNRIKVWDIIGRSMVVSGPAASATAQEANRYCISDLASYRGLPLQLFLQSSATREGPSTRLSGAWVRG